MSEQVNVKVVAKAKPESIREWYQRTTKKARYALFWATVVTVPLIVCLSTLAPLGFLTRAQTANGALTIPLVGAIWIFAFIFMFLVPSREASFRGQETLENGVDVVKKAIEEKLSPAAEVWMRVGKRVELEFSSVLETAKASFAKANETMDALQSAAKKIEVAVEKNEKVVEDIKPAIEALKRIEGKLEFELKAGLLEDLRTAAHSVQSLGGLPPMGGKAQANAKEEEDPVKLDWALQSIRKNKEKKT